MKSLILMLVFAVCVAAGVRAQGNWKPGVVILASGDTLRAELSERGMNSFECRIKGREAAYTPEEVISFYVPGEYYFERASIKVEEEWQTVFMKVLAAGQAYLLSYKDSYYLRDIAGEMTKLEVLVSQRQIDGKIYNFTSELYKEVLSKKFSDCDAASEKIRSTTLTARSLAKTFNIYNSCFQATQQFNVSIKAAKPKMYIGLQYNFVQAQLIHLHSSFKGLDPSNFDDPHKQSSAGFFMQFFPAQPKGVSFGLSFHKLSYEFDGTNSGSYFVPGPYQGDPGTWVHFVDKYHGEYSTTVVPLLVKYSLLSDRVVQPFFGLGIGLLFNKNFSGYRHGTYEGHEPIHESYSFGKKLKTSFFGQVGVNISVKRLLIGASFNVEQTRSPMDFKTVGGNYVGQQRNIGFTASVGFNLVK